MDINVNFFDKHTVIRADLMCLWVRVSTNLKSNNNTIDFKLYSVENSAANKNLVSNIHLKMAHPMKIAHPLPRAGGFKAGGSEVDEGW